MGHPDGGDVPDAPVKLRIDYDDAGDLLGEYDTRLAAGQAFFATPRALAQGSRVRLALAFPGLREPIAVDGAVEEVRGGEPAGVVVAFDPEARTAMAAAIARVRDRDPALVRRALRVLLVEDNPHLAGMLRGGLRAPSTVDVEFDLLTAANGREALDHLAAGGVDLAIVDIYLPVLDGAEVIRRARQELGLGNLPVIAVSAGGEAARTMALAAGANKFLDKPVRLREVFATVKELCQL